MTFDRTIPCVECGGTLRLLSTWPPDVEPQPGDILAYRCPDCLERFDVVVPDTERD